MMNRNRRSARAGPASHAEAADEVVPVPGTVTALRELSRRAGRYTIEIGGVAIAPVAVDAIADLALRVGREVDAAALARLLESSAITAAYDRALDALARRTRSTRDLERWLTDRDHPRAAVAVVLERLTALGLLDDLAFARAFAPSRAVGKGFGPRRVERELWIKGVPSAVVAEVMGEHREADAERGGAALEEAAKRRLRSLSGLEPAVARRRLLGWLLRRGFGGAEASDVVRRLLPGR